MGKGLGIASSLAMRNRPWEIGRRAEVRARTYAEARGWEILALNWRCRGGELDIVARDGGVLVILEVRCRANGEGIGSLSPAKLRALRNASAGYLRKNRSKLGWMEELRFDLVLFEEGGKLNYVPAAIYTF